MNVDVDLKQNQRQIALIAGSGHLPVEIVENDNRICAVIAFDGISSSELKQLSKKIPIFWTSLGMVGEMMNFLKKRSLCHLMMIGGIHRPSLKDLKLDKKGCIFLKKIGHAFLKGDDHLLRKIEEILEEDGFFLVPPPHKKMIPFALHLISDKDMRDIIYAHELLHALSPFDIGQSAIVSNGRVLGIEGIEGTQHLIERLYSFSCKKNGGILVKRVKKTQHHFLDLPTIGPKTIQALYKGGFHGLSIDEKTLIAQPSKTYTLLEKYGIFLHMA